MKKKVLSLALASTMSLSAGATGIIPLFAENQVQSASSGIQIEPVPQDGLTVSVDRVQTESAVNIYLTYVGTVSISQGDYFNYDGGHTYEAYWNKLQLSNLEEIVPEGGAYLKYWPVTSQGFGAQVSSIDMEEFSRLEYIGINLGSAVAWPSDRPIAQLAFGMNEEYPLDQYTGTPICFYADVSKVSFGLPKFTSPASDIQIAGANTLISSYPTQINLNSLNIAVSKEKSIPDSIPIEIDTSSFQNFPLDTVTYQSSDGFPDQLEHESYSFLIPVFGLSEDNILSNYYELSFASGSRWIRCFLAINVFVGNLSEMPSDKVWTVVFDPNDGSSLGLQEVKDGQSAVKPDNPVRNGYLFEGWFTSAEEGDPWDFDTPVEQNMTLYAHWTADQSGGSSGSGDDNPGGDNGEDDNNPGETPEQPGDSGSSGAGGNTGGSIPSNPSKPNIPSLPPTQPDGTVQGFNNGVEGSGPGFTEEGSSTQTDPSTGEQTTFTQDENGVKSATTQDSSGNITNVDVAITSQAIQDGKVSVDLGVNQETGEAIQLVPGNIADLDSAPNVNIELPENSGKVIVEIQIKPGTVVAGTVGLLKEDGSIVPIPTSAVVNGNLYLPLDGSATIVVMDNNKSFDDIPSNYSFYDAIEFAASHGLMNGLNDELFGPDLTVSRAQLAQILWNMNLRPDDFKSNSFGISPDEWYYDAVNWVNAAGIMTGYNPESFGAEDSLTREQLVTVLWRYSGSPIVNQSLSNYPDADQIGDYAQNAMKWAVSEGIIQGSNGKLLPEGDSVRYQAAIILQRFIENMYK